MKYHFEFLAKTKSQLLYTYKNIEAQKHFLKKDSPPTESTHSEFKTITNNKKYFNKPPFVGHKEYKITNNLNLFISNQDFYFEFTSQSVSSTGEPQNLYKFEVFHAYYLTYDGRNSGLRPANSNPGGAYILSTTELQYKKFVVDFEKSYFEPGSKITKIVLKFKKSILILTIPNSAESANKIQLESIWDPIDLKDKIPKEYLLVVKTDIDNSLTLPDGTLQPEFWTDSNGIKMMRRIKDFRSSYEYKVTEQLASNFYPVNAMISLFDRRGEKYEDQEFKNESYKSRKVTVLNDRAQSGGAMEPGEIIMIHNRHSNRDDRRGLADGIYENHSFNVYFRVNNYLVFGNDDDAIKDLENTIQERFNLFVWDGENERQAIKGIV